MRMAARVLRRRRERCGHDPFYYEKYAPMLSDDAPRDVLLQWQQGRKYLVPDELVKRHYACPFKVTPVEHGNLGMASNFFKGRDRPLFKKEWRRVASTMSFNSVTVLGPLKPYCQYGDEEHLRFNFWYAHVATDNRSLADTVLIMPRTAERLLWTRLKYGVDRMPGSALLRLTGTGVHRSRLERHVSPAKLGWQTVRVWGWRMIRRAVAMRAIALYWQEKAVMRVAHPEGRDGLAGKAAYASGEVLPAVHM